MRILSIRLAGVLLLSLLFEGVFLDVLAGDYWTTLNRSTSSDLTRLCFLDSLRGWVVGTRGTILKTSDGGNSWISQDAGIANDIVDVSILNEQIGWAIALQYPSPGSQSGTVLLKTTNGGALWEHNQYPVPDRYFESVEFLDSLRGWMGGDNGTFVETTDGGLSWLEANVDTSVYARLAVLRIEFLTPNIGFAVGGRIDFAGVVWKTTDSGQSWTATAVSPEPLHALHIFDSLNVLCAGGDLEYGPSVVNTTDAGEHWKYGNVGFFGEARGLSFRSRAEGWAPLGFSATGMFTLDSGRTWSPWSTPDTTAMYDVAFTDQGHGFMVGEKGTILKYNPLFSAVEVLPGAATPSRHALCQNYPNPFNPTTTIEYELPHAGPVTLRIYNLLGQEVSTLVNEMQAAGRHHLKFDAGGVAGGVYIYRMQTGSFKQSGKMLLLR